jgi:hypothetical protein
LVDKALYFYFLYRLLFIFFIAVNFAVRYIYIYIRIIIGIEISKAAVFAHMRNLRQSDFEYSLSKTFKSGAAVEDYESELRKEEVSEKDELNRKMVAALEALSKM